MSEDIKEVEKIENEIELSVEEREKLLSSKAKLPLSFSVRQSPEKRICSSLSSFSFGKLTSKSEIFSSSEKSVKPG